MRARVAMMIMVSACGTQNLPYDASSVDQAVVSETAADADPNDIAALASCIELPADLTAAWIKDRLVYNRSCFDAWTVSVPVSDCKIGTHLVNGEVRVAGEAMADVPQTGTLIRTRAATAALIDLANAVNGDIQPRIDVDVAGDGGMSVTACGAPVDGGLELSAGMALDHPVLGTMGIDGNARLARIDGVTHVDFAFSIEADPVDGPAVRGEVAGVELQTPRGQLCPESGEIQFTGTLGDQAAEVVLSYIGDGQALIALPDGQTAGPLSPRLCQ